MERVDIAVVGGGLAGLAAARGAAEGGVRVLLVEQRDLPAERSGVLPILRGDFEALELPASQIEAVVEEISVFGQKPGVVGGDLSIYLIGLTPLEQHVLRTARGDGAEVRDHSQVLRADVEGDRWKLTLAQGEPIMAHVVIAADGARSRTVRTLGVASAQRFSRSEAEIVRFLIGCWETPPSLSPGFRIRRGRGPLERWELASASGISTLAAGPVWGSIEREAQILGDAARAFGLIGEPLSLQAEEWRLDALPNPATFDGGLVVGSAAGHRPHEPLLFAGALLRAGRLAGQAAARAIRQRDWSACALGLELGPTYQALLERPAAELAFSARARLSGRLGAVFGRIAP